MPHRPGIRSFKTTHALITGGARGIGLATARRLLEKGSRVTIWDRDAAALQTALVELEAAAQPAAASAPAESRRVHTVACDILDYPAVRSAVAATEEGLGPIDVLVNNAGYLAPGGFLDQDADVWMTTLNVNVNALVYLTRLVLPGMYKCGHGHVVNISSAAGTIGVPQLAVYSASKWAVWGFSEALRGEARAHGVNVSSIHPSYIAQGMFAGARLTGLGRFIVPQLSSHDVVAKAIVEAALRRGRTSPKRPRSVRLAVLLRGILPDPWFNRLIVWLGISTSMSTWHGRGDS